MLSDINKPLDDLSDLSGSEMWAELSQNLYFS